MYNEEGDYPVIPDKDKPKSYDVESKSLSVSDVQRDMRSQVEYVVSVFGLEVHPLSFCSFFLNTHVGADGSPA